MLRVLKRALFVLATCTTIAVCIWYVSKFPAQSARNDQKQAENDTSPIYGIKIPAGYRDWRLISVKRLAGAGGKLMQLRAELATTLRRKPIERGSSRSRTAQSSLHCIGMKIRQRQTTRF